MLTSICRSDISNLKLVGFPMSYCSSSKLSAPDSYLSSSKLSMKCLHSLLSVLVCDAIIRVNALYYFSLLSKANTVNVFAYIFTFPMFLNWEKKRTEVDVFCSLKDLKWVCLGTKQQFKTYDKINHKIVNIRALNSVRAFRDALHEQTFVDTRPSHQLPAPLERLSAKFCSVWL